MKLEGAVDMVCRDMKLEDTANMMCSDDYKERFKAEYYQVVIRYKKLKNMLERWDEGLVPLKKPGTADPHDPVYILPAIIIGKWAQRYIHPVSTSPKW